MSCSSAAQRSQRSSEVRLSRSTTVSVCAKLSLWPIPSRVSAPFSAHSSGKISSSRPHLSSRSKPIEGLGESMILFSSSAMRSLDMMAMRSRLRAMASKVSGSRSKPSCEANRTARIMRSGSSLKVTSGSRGVTMRNASRSSSPPKGSTNSPYRPSFRHSARALMVKSRRF